MGRIARERRQHVCHYCGDREAQTFDHIVPKAWGGVDARWNIVRCCSDCNQAKGMNFPTCECPHCVVAVIRWRAGERRRVTRYLELPERAH